MIQAVAIEPARRIYAASQTGMNTLSVINLSNSDRVCSVGTPFGSIFRIFGKTLLGWMLALTMLGLATMALAESPADPLKPADRSSPGATLMTFLEDGDAVGEFLAKDYLLAPSRAKFHHLITLGDSAVRSLDLSDVPPAARLKTGRTAATVLYETLSRIDLPPLKEIPTADQLEQSKDTDTDSVRWVIPNTEIALELVQGGPNDGEFLFSADTVARADEFYERVRTLDYARPIPLDNARQVMTGNGGWMVPHAWVQAMPGWLREIWAEQALWKWIGFALILCIFALLTRWVHKLSHPGAAAGPFLDALAQLALPTFLLIATPAVTYLALVQLNLIGDLGSAIELIATALMFLAGAWIAWCVAPVIAEAIIASPRIASESIDAHLIRICTRLHGHCCRRGIAGDGG